MPGDRPQTRAHAEKRAPAPVEGPVRRPTAVRVRWRARRGVTLQRVADSLAEEMRLHMAEPFPDAVRKGLTYGQADAVMIGADIYGWAERAGSLSELDRSHLHQAADALQSSINAFPLEARPHYERILRIARLALDS